MRDFSLMEMKQASFKNDFSWQMKYLPVVKNLVGPLLLKDAPMEIDKTEATDLMVLVARDMRIGCRIRRAGYADKYGDEFTIRSHRDSGAKTELAKITEGWGDWLFYGHAEHDDLPVLARWMIVDLHAWRAHMIRHKDKIRFGKKANGDGTYFVWFDVRSFPNSPPICIAEST